MWLVDKKYMSSSSIQLQSGECTVWMSPSIKLRVHSLNVTVFWECSSSPLLISKKYSWANAECSEWRCLLNAPALFINKEITFNIKYETSWVLRRQLHIEHSSIEMLYSLVWDSEHLCFGYIPNFDINFDISRWGGTPSEPGPFRQLELCHRSAHQSQYYTCLERPTVSMPRSLSGPHYLHFLSEVRRGRVRRSRCMLLE